ncbi:BLUF domain-containing protein [Undibacterium sp. RTI2.1]|uniref:BLUF domain-containing protein n=1 Tax=unclassified Undibacterium TaxID=2630295 RepID=UPI002AB35EA8|nr:MULTISPECIES: BLUF domain-containing protein [unclassified Undibacterium]MDY7539043.1 BLUF domain-containing protein [Undibacterium sp. 5I1]MEB0032440.1 BLUF domain-containing protein [Undibacterium sp. RTI2.1]MEB0115879.1 BLUF domain-containing protein [Undibacterium sp. RTI2.2]MEB0229823.1 BLUF domain-containing protein [Undibacterium sp. 10I3]MEB0258272.1 BLUF domain-containing protein [Undibacterium sp. 5I1]
MMIRLIYASRAVNLGPADVKDILASSRRNNQKLAVTGALNLSNGIFLQCLEGERSAVNAVYHHILRDKRHTKPEVLSLEEITQRQFTSWNMGLIASTTENTALFLKYSPTAEFDPYGMSAHALKEFFTEVMSSARWLS